MASITLTGTLLDPTGEVAVGDQIRFTHRTTTGETIQNARSIIIIPPDGMYNFTLEFGLIFVEYLDIKDVRYKSLGVVTVNQDSTATSLPELLNAIVPPTDEQLLEFQAILADCVTAQNAAEGFADDAAQSAIDAANSAASVDWLAIRYSKLDNPLTHLFKKNQLVETLSSALTWSRASNATYIDRYGVLQTAAIDEPREEAEGWLIEGDSTNLLLRSEEFDNAAWGKTGATVTANNLVSPDGATTGDTLVVTLAGNSNCIQIISVTSGVQVTVSGFFKKGTTGFTRVRIANVGFPVTVPAFFDLDNVTVVSALNADSASIESVANGWLRWQVTLTPTATGNLSVNLQVSDDGVSVSTGEVGIWGAQLETLPFASSYIKTTTTAEPRAADDVSIPAAGNMTNHADEHSFLYTVKTLGFRAGKNQSVFASFVDDDFNRANYLWSGGNKTILNYLSGTSFGFSTTNDRQVERSIATTYDGATLIAYGDGVLVRSDAAAYTDADSPTTVFIGRDPSDSGANLFGHMLDFRIYDFALNAAEVSFLSGE